VSHATVRAAFRAALASGYAGRWTIVDTINTPRRSGEGRARLPDQCVAAEFYAAEELQESIGGDGAYWEETGMVLLRLIDTSGATDDGIVAEADFLRRLFRRWRGEGGTLVVEEVTPVDLGDGADRGARFEGAVEIRYSYQFLHVPIADRPRALAGDEAGNTRALAGDEAGNTRILAGV
jgi:hypothetical protein